jgi:hypothetical protein
MCSSNLHMDKTHQVEMFWKHLALLKDHFCFKKFITRIDWVTILALRNERKLDPSTSLFKITMSNNHFVALEPPPMCNPISWLWSKLVTSYNINFLSIFPWVELYVFTNLGIVKDECYFSTLSFMNPSCKIN